MGHFATLLVFVAIFCPKSIEKEDRKDMSNTDKNLKFVIDFVSTHEFFIVNDTLYVIANNTIYNFDDDFIKHYVNLQYQNTMNALAPTGNFLLDNIKSRALSLNLAVYDKGYSRIMQLENKVIVDLSSNNSLVMITEDGYQIVDRLMSRHLNLLPNKYQVPMLNPIESEHNLLDLINHLTNFSSFEELFLFTTWIIASYFSMNQMPILVLLGDQGSGKTFTSKLIKDIVDPSKIKHQHKVSSSKDLGIIMENNYLTVLDNLSTLSDEMSDALCQTVSGGQVSTRKLYTTKDIETIDLVGRIVINGINIDNTRPDLLERSIIIELTKIKNIDMLSEVQMSDLKTQLIPQIHGKIFESISYVLGILDQISLTSKPRMADYATLLVAIGLSLDVSEEESLSIYEENVRFVNGIITDDPLIEALIKVLHRCNDYFEGTASDLLRELFNTGISGLPKAANSLSAKIGRLKSDLGRIGITIEKEKLTGGIRIIKVFRHN